MIDLHSTRWNELTTAYGKASNIPALIEKLKTSAASINYQSEPWFSLWSALCHQTDIFDASYAAVSHIAAVAVDKPLIERLEFVHFISSIEAYRHKENSPSLPDDLKQSYLLALEQTVTLILECLQKNWNETDYRILLGSLAVIRGQYKLGLAIIELERENICPVCEADFTTSAYELLD